MTMFSSYKQALDMLANEEVLAPVYYILGGTKSGEVSCNNHSWQIKECNHMLSLHLGTVASCFQLLFWNPIFMSLKTFNQQKLYRSRFHNNDDI